MASEEDQKLFDAFKALKVKLKADTPDELHGWLNEFDKHQEAAPHLIPYRINSIGCPYAIVALIL